MSHFRLHSNCHAFNDQGFGSLGLIIAILFLGIGTALVLTTLSPGVATARLAETIKKGETLKISVERYRAHRAANPSNLDELLLLGVQPPCSLDNVALSPTYLSLTGWCGPYVARIFSEDPDDWKSDGWGSTFQFLSGTGVLRSCGPDRTCGNGDDLAYAL